MGAEARGRPVGGKKNGAPGRWGRGVRRGREGWPREGDSAMGGGISRVASGEGSPVG